MLSPLDGPSHNRGGTRGCDPEISRAKRKEAEEEASKEESK